MPMPQKPEMDPKLPGMSDDAMVAATGKGWAEWVELINAWPGAQDGHTAVATWLSQTHNVEGWWAQGITVGWERITGRRKVHQQADGTFTASSSRTLHADFGLLKVKLFDDAQRDQLLGLEGTHVKSRPISRSVRVRYEESIILFDQYPNPDGRIRISVTHEKLRNQKDVRAWKAHWSAWLKALPEE